MRSELPIILSKQIKAQRLQARQWAAVPVPPRPSKIAVTRGDMSDRAQNRYSVISSHPLPPHRHRISPTAAGMRTCARGTFAHLDLDSQDNIYSDSKTGSRGPPRPTSCQPPGTRQPEEGYHTRPKRPVSPPQAALSEPGDHAAIRGTLLYKAPAPHQLDRG